LTFSKSTSLTAPFREADSLVEVGTGVASGPGGVPSEGLVITRIDTGMPQHSRLCNGHYAILLLRAGKGELQEVPLLFAL